jgi:hypothetical protein
MALRAAVWLATAVTAAAFVAIAAAPDQLQRYRPARTGPRRWEAGWAGRTEAAGHGQAAVAAGWQAVAAG